MSANFSGLAGAAADRVGSTARTSGREITRVVVDDDTWLATAITNGVPEFGAKISLSMFQAARAGEFAVTDPTLGTILHRDTTDVRDVLARWVTQQQN